MGRSRKEEEALKEVEEVEVTVEAGVWVEVEVEVVVTDVVKGSAPSGSKDRGGSIVGGGPGKESLIVILPVKMSSTISLSSQLI